jgi:polyketide synthase PksN
MVAGHVVGGRPLLPGTGHLHLLATAVGGTRHLFTDVRWVRPVTVDAQPSEVTLRVDGAGRFELMAGAAVHSSGTVVAGPEGATGAHRDVDELRRRSRDEVTGAQLYRDLAAAGLDYGPAFRRVERVWVGDREAVARLVAPSGLAGRVGAAGLDPIILDAALHAVAVLARRDPGTQGTASMPFAADRVETLGPLPESGWSVVRVAESDRYDVDLLDDDGRQRARIRGLVLRPGPATDRVPTFLPVWVVRQLRETAEPPGVRRVLVTGPEPDGVLASAVAGAHPIAEVVRRAAGDGAVDDGLPEGSDVADLVYFVAAAEAEPATRADVVAAQERGVVALYRLVRSLDRAGALRRPMYLKVVTQDAFPLADTDPARPLTAGLAGLAGVLAKEYPSLRVACVDVRTTDVGADAAAVARHVVAEPFAATCEPVSWRGGVRRVRRLRPVELPERDGLRPGGTYLVIGGMGVLGRDTCRYLAARYGARLVILGRSPLDERRRAALAEIERAGAEVEYLSGDATDPAVVRDAVTRTRQRFGDLHGVVNAAMVLVNRPVRELDEADLRRALEVKVGTAWALVEALRHEPLDVVLLHSSAVSFASNYGQAGYAAGCAAADALMADAARRTGLPVRVVNWGYWHAGGDPTRGDVLRRAARAGIEPIGAAEGMRVVESMVAGPVGQVVAVRADRRILADLGVDRDDGVAATGPSEPSPLAAVPTAAPDCHDADLVAFQEGSAALDRLGIELAGQVLRDAGVVAPAAESTGRLFDCLAGLLADAGLATRAGDRLVPTTAGAASRREDIDARLAALAEAQPALRPAITLLLRCVDALPAVFAGTRVPLDVLFPGGDSSLVTALYAGDPVSDRCNDATARAVTACAEELVRRGLSRPVRVLEVGAGTGSTTRAVLAALAPQPSLRDHLEYVYTDVSASFVRRGRQDFADRYPFTRFEVLDIDADLAGWEGSVDIVVAANVLHATPRIGHTLAQVKRLLRPGGALVVNEGTAPRPAMTLVFGLTQGWWAFADPEHRLSASPLLGLPAWQDVLADAGFRRVRPGSAIRTPAGPVYQSVLLAESDPVVPLKGKRPAPADHPTAAVPVPAAAPDDAVAAARRYVAGVFARVLELDVAQLDPDATFDLYGIDSLVALEIIRALEADLGPLPATLLFEQVTVGRLALHLVEAHGRALRAVVGTAPEEKTPREPVAPPAGPDGADLAELVRRMSDEEVTAVVSQLSTVLAKNLNGGRGRSHG